MLFPPNSIYKPDKYQTRPLKKSVNFILFFLRKVSQEIYKHRVVQIPTYITNSTMGKAVSTLTNDDLSHLKQKTYFDKREIKQWYKGFTRDCPQGYLTKEEFIKIYSQFFPFGDATEFASYIFRSFDQNKDDAVDFSEFILGLSITSRGTIEEKLDWSFRMYDIRDENEISFDDMLLVVTSIYKMFGTMFTDFDEQSNETENVSPESRVTEIFNKLDKTGKGFINKQEFQNACKLDSQILSALNIYDGLI